MMVIDINTFTGTCSVLQFLSPDSDTTPITIGFQQAEYTVVEGVDSQFVCVEVQSGDAAGRDITLYHVVEDSGKCIYL